MTKRYVLVLAEVLCVVSKCRIATVVFLSPDWAGTLDDQVFDHKVSSPRRCPNDLCHLCQVSLRACCSGSLEVGLRDLRSDPRVVRRKSAKYSRLEKASLSH